MLVCLIFSKLQGLQKLIEMHSITETHIEDALNKGTIKTTKFSPKKKKDNKNEYVARRNSLKPSTFQIEQKHDECMT